MAGCRRAAGDAWHIDNNYEHNVIRKVNKHIKHINNYETEIYYLNKQSFNKINYSCSGHMYT